MTEKQFEVVFNGSDFQLRNNENNEELHLTDEKVCYDYIADLLNYFHEENEQLKSKVEYLERKIDRERTSYQKQHEKWEEEIQKENEQLKQTIKEVTELLEEEVDLFSDKATEHDINAYVELKQLDNKDAYYMAKTTKTAIKMLKELQE